MKVYLSGAFSHRQRLLGHGEAAHHAHETLKKMGVSVKTGGEDLPDDYKADIEIAFTHPECYDFKYLTSYKIGYTAWESTEFKPDWWENFDKCDEIWTPSNWMLNIFRQKLPHKNVRVWQHGISEEWVPKKRTRNSQKPFTFLSISEPFDRKDAQLIVDTFAELYGDNPNFKLILKCSRMDRTKKTNPNTLQPYSNIEVYTEYFTTEQMKHLYASADVFVYPSWGEGFGLQPLEAMSLGIPTICTTAWADYKKYITIPLSSTYELSPWQEVHPGFMLKPDKKQFKLAMKYAYHSYEELCDKAFKNAFDLHNQFDWEKVTEPAVERLKEIYNSRI
jgi:glycosyltransferase involved in cell wall biosynthesis